MTSGAEHQSRPPRAATRAPVAGQGAPAMSGRSRVESVHPVADPLVLGLVSMVRSAISRRVQLSVWAVQHDVVLVEACSCRYRTGEVGCVCNVELTLGDRWMRALATRAATGGSLGGPPPRLRCRLCRAGEHDLEPTIPIRIVARDGTELRTDWVASRSRRSLNADRARAMHAGGLAPGTRDAQWAAAGLKG